MWKTSGREDVIQPLYPCPLPRPYLHNSALQPLLFKLGPIKMIYKRKTYSIHDIMDKGSYAVHSMVVMTSMRVIDHVNPKRRKPQIALHRPWLLCTWFSACEWRSRSDWWEMWLSLYLILQSTDVPSDEILQVDTGCSSLPWAVLGVLLPDPTIY